MKTFLEEVFGLLCITKSAKIRPQISPLKFLFVPFRVMRPNNRPVSNNDLLLHEALIDGSWFQVHSKPDPLRF
jgi:hypothetical protein